MHKINNKDQQHSTGNYTVSPLHTNLQVVNFHRCENARGSSKEPEPEPATSGMNETAARPPSPIADDPSAPLTHLLPLLQSATLLARSLDASPCTPAVVMYYCTFQSNQTVRLKIFSSFLCLLFMYCS